MTDQEVLEGGKIILPHTYHDQYGVSQKKNGRNYIGSERACEKKGVLTWH